MYGRSASARLGLLLLLLLPSTQAHARKYNLSSGFPLGIGFAAGVERAPSTSFTNGTRTSSSSFGHYFLFQPYFDLVNVTFQPYVGWHFYPDQHGAEANFAETSSAGNFSYGMRVMLSPFLSRGLDARGYILLAAGMASAKLRNVRSYQNAAGVTTSVNTERVSGSGLELAAGAGMEFFLVQNYSLQLEGGYVQRNIDGFKYDSKIDVTGATRTSGEDVLDANGRKKGFHVWSPYLQLAFNLHF